MFFSSRKQIGVIYRAYKSGKVTVSKDSIDFMYSMAGRMTGNNGRFDQDLLACHLGSAIDAILKRGDYEKAQRCLDAFAERLALARELWGDGFTKANPIPKCAAHE